MPAFSSTEMRRRADGLRTFLAELDIDVAFFNSADNVFYLTGVPLLSEWGRPMWAVVPAAGRSAVCGAAIELENIERHSSFDEALIYADDENVVSASLKLCSDFIAGSSTGKGRIGVEIETIPLGVYRELEARFPEAEFVDVGHLAARLRLIKSEEELGWLELGAQVAKIGADAFIEALGEGVTELSVSAHALSAMEKALGGLSDNGLTSSYVYAQFGEHTLTPHLHPTSRRLRRGDVVALNVFPVIWGYCTELERTFVFGAPSKAQTAALDAVNEAFEAGKAAVKPGARMSDIDKLTRGILRRHEVDQYIRHGTGHAHGIMIGAASREERGELRSYNDTLLAPDMANSVEPGIYIPEIGGFRHSDVLLLTGAGARCITDFPRDIVLP